jgi:hypothetical protein
VSIFQTILIDLFIGYKEFLSALIFFLIKEGKERDVAKNSLALKSLNFSAKESRQYLGFILFCMNHTFTSMIHTKKE